ncbi:PREDICTED: 39S ribosomal protein L55, mitochondrial-like [Galeopterus variegatus]|uniref:39S ribosomal protein L55, mitochondrial-like n=1 Tax=Galeopterus variegatus TaxID=482537 RepID=A0ABM0S6X6_GALVR|nr:PREDICTED: 39S ribosomal protein L55, mitochondrial-like [Galeopterus variegatus]XP_008588617.1 PREDICTED: 39S ribosomal protein L55, mitochondrial-like [Galeopterus variegatus]
MAAMGTLLGLLRQSAMKAATPMPHHLHTSSWWADSNRALLTRVRRQAYARLYPVLLVRQDGSTIHIRYREPRRMLAMPIDLDTLSPEERRARLRRREAQLRPRKEEEPEPVDSFDVERYRRFWTKTKK